MGVGLNSLKSLLGIETSSENVILLDERRLNSLKSLLGIETWEPNKGDEVSS